MVLGSVFSVEVSGGKLLLVCAGRKGRARGWEITFYGSDFQTR